MKKNPRKRHAQTTRPPARTSQARSKAPPPRNLTPALCDRLRRDMMQACLVVAQTHGLTVEGGELSDINLRHNFNIGLRVGIPMVDGPMVDGAIYSPDKAMFEVPAP